MRGVGLCLFLSFLVACTPEARPGEAKTDAVAAICRPEGVAPADLMIGDLSFTLGSYNIAAVPDAIGRPSLVIRFDPYNAQRLATVTETHIGKALDFKVDGDVLMSPVVMETITGGEVIVSGDFSTSDLEVLAERLSLPCPEEN